MKRVAGTLAAFGLLAAPALAGPLDGYAPVDLTDFQPKEGPSAIGLLVDLIEAHPESLEGNPATKIEMKPTGDGRALQVDVEMTGYLDDAVDGEKYRAILMPASTWRIEALGRQIKCRRGDSAGEWTTNLCP
jgi:hypothetical protein